MDGEEAGRPAGERPPANHTGDGEEGGGSSGARVPAARALREAGFPKSSCQHGLRGIDRMVCAELKSLGRKYIEMGRDLTPEDQELIVRGRLLENVIIGTDKGVLSAKQLGADKRISMCQPDSQVGMVILKPPPIAELDHEVPWIKTRYQEEEEKELKAKSHEEQEPTAT